MHKLLDTYIDKIMEKSTPDAPYWNIESIRQGKKPHWNYIDGCMMISLLELYKETKDEKYFKFVENFVDYYVFEDGSLRGYDQQTYNLDDINESRVLFDLFEQTKKEKYEKAIFHTFNHILEQPRTPQGNFWHKKIYPNQVWLDGLFMAQPFYTRFLRTYKSHMTYDDIMMQFENVRKYMFNEEKKLYYHGYDASKSIFWADKNTGLSQNFWLRAMGWFVVAIVDVYSFLPDDYQPKDKILKPMLQEIVDGLLNYQDEKTKLFYQVVDQGGRAGNYLEASGSSLISYAILKGTRLHALPKTYQSIGEGIFHGVCDTYLREKDGELNLGGICLVAGLGPENNLRRDGSYEYYISEPIVSNDAKGVGPLIMAYTEIRKLK
jgi:unsaturated rhamnogalacturonyl hydrolase